MRIRITLDIRTTPRASKTPPTAEAATPIAPADTTPFGFSLDGTALGSDTERAQPYDDGRGTEYEDDDARTGGPQ